LRRGTAKLQYKSDAPSSTPPFAPTDIAGLQLWLDASDASSVTLDGSNNVEQWNDKSGNARHATQATALLRPAYSTAAVNSLNAVTFNGTSHRVATGSFSVSQPYTLCVVISSTNNGSFRVMFESSSPRMSLFSQSGTSLFYNAGSDISGSVTISTNVARLITGVFAGASSSLRFDKSAVSTTSPGTNAIGGGCTIGSTPSGTFPFAGSICEILLYNTALSGTDLTNVESYLSSRWGTA
jgi:hypothetical protein